MSPFSWMVVTCFGLSVPLALNLVMRVFLLWLSLALDAIDVPT